ncbi:diguanylate cyclase domain-containing protein [Planosporangium sp. 12N6]|uniref:diguanylate cyclase domain-containing protein n=1 Tax=Planosporangium spinosum TaxID=3402278 RepID=UPI003CEBB4B4
MDSIRQTSGVTIRAILRHVRATGGPEAVARTLALAGATEDPESYDDARRWWSWDFKIRLFESAATALNDPDVARKVGLTILEHTVGTPLILALSVVGGPTQLMRLISTANVRFSTCADMSAVRVRRGAATIRYQLRPQFRPHRHDCEYNQGLLTQVPTAFGYPLGVVTHRECQVRGAEACVYEVRWRQGGLFAGRRAASNQLRGTMLDQLAQLQHTVSELVTAQTPDRILATVAERAGFAVGAHAFLLVAQPSADQPVQVHGFGLPQAEIDRLTADGGRVPPGADRLIAEIASPTRRYGHLVAFSDAFLDAERTLLDSYANLAAVTLDALTAVEAAAERERTAESLLGLARALTHARNPADVARVTTEAAHAVLHADQAAMLLMDAAGGLHVAGHVGWRSEFHDTIEGLALEAEQSPGLFEMRRGHPDATTIYDHTSTDPLIRRILAGGGMDVLAVVGIALPDRLYGLLVAGFIGPHGAARAQRFAARMPGVANQAATVLRTCELLDQTWRLAHLDALTGLPNRRAFMAELAAAVRAGSGALLFIDLDGFKGINDSLGHAAGDDLLAAVAGRLQGCSRSGDLVARLGGDEFVVLARPVDGEPEMRRIAQRIREAFTEPVAVSGGTVRVRLSVDGTRYTAGESAEDVLNRADSAMYRVKRARRPVSDAYRAAG